MAQMPIVGDPEHPRLALYHHGMLVGFNNGVYLFPETETVIVLLSNAVAINDGPDWIGHLIMQTLFNDSIKHGYVALARQTLDFGLDAYTRIQGEFEAELVNQTFHQPKSLDAYVGMYYNQVRTFFMGITIKDEELWMNLQGNELENCKLKHHNGDEFTRHMTRNEQVKRGRNPITYTE
ncbi:hypothetical protein AK830_g5398 [Neonectria ditissima]|uniref:Peptidase S12 Pab87-related C-terminal domain-containing protein n=1 Tax=Neonectria ditissima TaxID=78410 RepID=A0A0P7BEF8_9HYPO|nr:hypothetical protein AK830_g5398 [Neonectria ditissima]